MDVDGESGIDWPRTEFPNGHSVKDNVFGFVVPRRNYKIDYERSYDFHCAETPTSWTVYVTLLQPYSGSPSCLTYIKRTDNGPRLVNVQFWAAIHMNTDCFDVSYAQHFISGISAGRGDRQIASFPPRNFKVVEFRVQFLFIVHGCHGVQYASLRATEEAVATDHHRSSLKESLLFLNSPRALTGREARGKA
ncbi:unnamed protein product [Larinioides sclopetarius]|uniref:Uncharacterized protein n=1 Tax=Larinioides sclopetarius TaxID=280406 RepID=A0AAV2BWR5_9ARAC